MVFDVLEDKELIKRYLEGDETSLDFLIERYLKIIYSFIYKNVGDQSVSEDITQEVFVKVWKNIRKFDQTKNFKPWLFQIAKNTSIDFLRKKKSIPFSKFEDESGKNALVENIAEKPANLLEKISDKNTVADIIEKLTDKEQTIITLRHIEGLNFREISERNKESINTVKSRYRRAIASIRTKTKN